MKSQKYDCVATLQRIGISFDDATALRRISMTLHRWHELECGDSTSYMSTALVRGQKVNSTFEYADDGAPYMETHFHDGSKTRYYSTPDREAGALKRLKAIMARYPALSFYVQGDPRGASLYILQPGDVPKGEDVGAYYSRGIAVYK